MRENNFPLLKKLENLVQIGFHWYFWVPREKKTLEKNYLLHPLPLFILTDMKLISFLKLRPTTKQYLYHKFLGLCVGKHISSI